ncbi:lysophospholipid acyltransferase family protein [Vibrio sp.]|nr:lysophospholipid acyltransferase family protein [Vibrio sp.]
MITSPFRLPRKTPFGIAEKTVEWVTGLSQLDKHYQKRPLDLNSTEFMGYTLQALGIRYAFNEENVQNIPKEGPVVIVANHPLGGVEGVILAEMLGKLRDDVKVLANEMLKRIPEIDDLFIGIDVFEGKQAQRTNVQAIRDAHKHLENGGLLVIFPAGEVSTYDDEQGHVLRDNEWRLSVAKFIKRHQTPVVPVFIGGKNSTWFYRAGRVHPLLRTAMLGRELLNKKNQTIELSIGHTLPYSELKNFDNERDMVNYLRLNTYLMGPKPDVEEKPAITSFDTPIIDAIMSDVLVQELSQLPADMKLLTQGDFEVYCAPSHAIPQMMMEIGRVREESFREVGEGSGLACDVDEYDLYYHQLFVWNTKDQCLVGSYRLGLVDQLIEQKGLNALYTKSLFQFEQPFIDTMGNSIELGRSVVAKQYQRNLNSLLLLWKGIAEFVHRHPQYDHLFGPVSISSDYSLIARQLMAATLSIHHYDTTKASLVTPSTPLVEAKETFWKTGMLTALGNVSLLSKVLTRMEKNKGLPVLLRQYLGMNGKLVCFNVDPAFNNALDGLIVVNLKNVPVKTLGKYMGQDKAKNYLADTINE